MHKKSFFPTLFYFSLLGSAVASLSGVSASSLVGTKTLVLYDAASGAIPTSPLLGFTDFPPGAASPTYSNGVTVMDTTAAGRETYAGWVSNGASTPGFPILDGMAGFQVDFTIQVENESHTNNNRAGFSIILLGEDTRGIELAFWQNEIWAQSDESTGGLFRHGEAVAFATTTGLTEYQLTIVGDTYTLAANANPILTGPVRDYSAFDGFPDPYQTPNLLFLGDDTTSAQARVRLSFVSVRGTEPVLPTGTVTSTSTSTLVPTASFTPLPSATPISSPTPAGRVFESCPSSLVVVALLLMTSMMAKKIRAG